MNVRCAVHAERVVRTDGKEECLECRRKSDRERKPWRSVHALYVLACEQRAARDHLIVRWKADHPECEDSLEMLSECFNYSEAFADFARSNGFLAQVVSGFVIVDNIILQGHAATLIDDTVYDWTNRQFILDCPVPTITPLVEWRLTWKTLT